MIKITRLSAQAKDQSRVNIEVDGEFVTGLSLEEVLKQRLVVGKEIAKDLISSWKVQDERGKILGKTLNFLSYRPRTTFEVENRLKVYSKDSNIYAYVMKYLNDNDLLNDQSFALRWVNSRKATHSVKVLQQELRYKGISPAIISFVLPDKSSDNEALVKLLTKKLKYNSSLLPKDRARLYRYCLGKGFSYELIDQAFLALGKSISMGVS
ncbi:MAG: RecX family transcriptional regulator [bacterium]